MRTTPLDVTRTMLTIQQVRAILGVSRRTVYNWIAAGKIEATYTPGGSVRIYQDSLTGQQTREGNDNLVVPARRDGA